MPDADRSEGEDPVAALRRELERADELLAFAAHELKTPATSLEGYAYLLARRGDDADPETRRRCVQGIGRNVARLGALVTELLELARVRRGRLEVRRERFDLAEAVRSAAEIFAAQVEAVAPGPLLVTGDRRRIEDLAREMLFDALNRAAGAAVRIEARAEGPEAIVEVCDRGPPVGADHLARGFGGSRRAGGFAGPGAGAAEVARGGLGLALGAEVIGRLGGRTFARSGAEGNVLGFALPLAERDGGPPIRAAPSAPE